MNDEAFEPFGSMAPQQPSPELRARVLSAVGRELNRGRPERVCGWTVAASLVIGVSLNAWQQSAEVAWQERVYGPMPVPSAIAETTAAIATVADAESAEWFRQRWLQLQAARRAGPATL